MEILPSFSFIAVFNRCQYENIFAKCIPYKLLSSAAALLTDLTPFQQLESFAKQLLVRPPSLIQNNTVSTLCCDTVVSFATNTAHLVHHMLMFTVCGFCSSTSTERKRITPLLFDSIRLVSKQTLFKMIDQLSNWLLVEVFEHESARENFARKMTSNASAPFRN